MFGTLLDFLAVVLPFLVSLLGVHMSASLSKKQKAALIGSGLLVSVLVVFQQLESRRSHEIEVRLQREQIENLRQSLENSRISGDSGQAYLRGQLDSVNKTLGALVSNSDPKQTALILKQITTDQSTLKGDTVALCSEIESWWKKQPPAPQPAIPGKPTQLEQEAQNAYFNKVNSDYYQRFSGRALGIAHRFGAKGVNIGRLDQQAEYGYLPMDLIIQLRAFANQLNERGDLKR